jgi:hypothetical protein
MEIIALHHLHIQIRLTNHIEWELGAIQYQSVPSWKKTTEGYKQEI